MYGLDETSSGAAVTPGPNNPIEAENVSKRYRRTVALRDVSLGIPARSVCALVGPNAAGKSTLLRTFVGFERPTTGRVRVGGADPVRDRSAALRRIGYIPQTPALYRELSVAEHVELAARLRAGFDRAGAARRLSRLGVPAHARAGELSGGQQAQVALALVLASGADLLLLDEPLASLDPLARAELLAVLVEAARERGATVVLSSHIVDDLGGVCDRLIVLGVGRVLFDGVIVEALATHRVADGSIAGAIGVFPAADGRMESLIRDGVGRPATLDEIALGYLAAGRAPRDDDLGWASH